MQTSRRLVVIVALAVLTVSCGVEPGGSVDEPNPAVSSVPASTTSVASTTTVDTVGGDLVEGVTGVLEGGGAFWLDADGSYRFGDPDVADTLGYDASTLVAWSVVGPHHALNIGHPPSGPDSITVDASFGSEIWLEGLRRSRSGDGNDVSWTTIERGDPHLGETAEIECTHSLRLDPETLLMMAASRQCGERQAVVYEVVDFNSRAKIDPAVFRPPATVNRVVSDQGFRHITLDEARALVAYDLLVPTLPTGYALTTVVYSPHAAHSPVELWGMPSLDVVVMVFRDGFQTVTVTTRTHTDTWKRNSGSLPEVWDPWHGEFGRGSLPHQGSIDGIPVSFARIDDGNGRAWATLPEIVITIEGALSDSELDAAVNSFTTR